MFRNVHHIYTTSTRRVRWLFVEMIVEHADMWIGKMVRKGTVNLR